jgi:predicted ATPase/DNA-binding CsgD family transcriptional regulator
LTTHGGRLPAETSRFFGRSHEAAAIQDALARSRLVTLTGPGGVGKTRLAVKVAGEHARRFRDGVFLADLSAARDPGDVARTVAAALGPPGREDERDRPGPARAGGFGGLAGRLRGRRLLLILDTCEHVVDACAALADEVLCEGGGPVLLLTSRQPLGLPGELVVRVPPLVTKDAVRLFADRAGAAAPGFAATAYTMPKIERLCRLLDGSPLAIELAALRLRATGLDELLVRLPGQLRLLGSGRLAAGDRRHSLQASISWSYDLCSPAERLLWTRLSVFDGSFDLAAAEGVYPDDDPGAHAVFGTLAGLVDKSVVLRVPDAGGVARYRLPALAREHGAALRTGATIRNAVPRPRPATSPRRRVSPAGQALAARPSAPAAGPGGGAELDDAGYAAAWALLTAREREVADLVAMGLTSKDIAARLVVSKRTVDSHLEHILGKLGYNSRVQVAALAAHEQARQQRELAEQAAPDGEAQRSG